MEWAAVDLSAPGEPGIGIARCIRLGNQPTAAGSGSRSWIPTKAAGCAYNPWTSRRVGATLHNKCTLRGYLFAEHTPMLKLFADSQRAKDSKATGSFAWTRVACATTSSNLQGKVVEHPSSEL